MEVYLVPKENSLESFEAVKAAARFALTGKYDIKHVIFEACREIDSTPEIVPNHEKAYNHCKVHFSKCRRSNVCLPKYCV